MVVYLIMVSISLTGFWLYYYLFLRNRTFFKLNRAFLLFALVFSLLAPLAYYFLPMAPPVQKSMEVFPYGTEAVTSVKNIKQELDHINPSNNNIFSWVMPCYFLVVGLLFFRFVWGLFAVYRLKTKSLKATVLDGVVIHYCKEVKQPFSVSRAIYLPVCMLDAVPDEIFKHEQAHIRQWHVLDIMLAEIIAIVLWFNPFMYAFKRSVKLNLEYLADQAVIGQGFDILNYQSSLLDFAMQKQMPSSLALQFNSPLKNRLIMMKKENSKLWQRLLIIGAIPLAALLMALNVKEEVRKPVKYVFSPFAFQDQDSEIPNRSPFDTNAKVKITAKFGMRMHPILKYKKMHTGVDISAEKGTPIYATADGFVTYAKDDGDWGNHVQIKHSDKYITTYAHLNDFRVLNGEFVKKGQLIGHVGNTGKSMGPHLHYEVYEDSKAIDPEKFIGGC